MKIFNNKSADFVIGKELEELGEIKIKLRANIDVVNPVIKLKAGFIDFNYCYIEKLKRFYFVRDYQEVGGIVSLFLEVDLLGTYANEIKGSKARYRRKLKTGDYYNFSVDKEHITDVETIETDGAVELVNSYVFSTIGE